MIKAPRYQLKIGRETYFNPISVGTSMVKTASEMKGYAPEVAEFASSIKAKDGLQYVLINAVSAYEYWGCNINADAFKEEEFTTNERHKTFTSHAHPYRNHVNKDPKISYGKVMFATYNPRMHRVELICEYDRKKADDICKRIDDNEDVRVSMGCRVAYDVCSICGNKAKTTAEYCDHLRHDMKKIMPDGRIVCAFNPNPTFFDISVVWIPADKTARIMHKIASDQTGMYKNTGGLWVPEDINSEAAAQEHGYTESGIIEKSADDKTAENKMAALAKRAVQKKLSDIQKKSEIEKQISGEALGPATEKEIQEATKETLPKLREEEPEIDAKTLDSMSESFPLSKILSSLGLLGILPKPREFQRLFLNAHGHRDMADEFDRNGISFESEIPSARIMIIKGRGPKPMDSCLPSEMSADSTLASILPMLGSLLGEKSYYAAPVVKRVIKITIMQGGPEKTGSAKLASESLVGSMQGYLLAIAASYLYAKARTLGLLPGAAGLSGGALDQAFMKSPEAMSALLGAGGLGLMAALRGGMSVGNNQSEKTYPSDYLYAKKGTYSEDGKIASVITPGQANLIAALTMGQLGTHLAKGYIDASDQSDYIHGQAPSHNPIKNLVKQYPGYLGLALSGGALYKGLI